MAEARVPKVDSTTGLISPEVLPMRAISDFTNGPNQMDIREFGAVGDGVTDDSDAFEAAARWMAQGTERVGGVSDPMGTRVVTLPAMEFLVTRPLSFLSNDMKATRALGIAWFGAACGPTRILFRPTAASTFMQNARWQRLMFRDISFIAQTPGCTFFDSGGLDAAQDFRFENVEWRMWHTGIVLSGINHNSEWRWTGCRNTHMEDDGVFLFSDAAASDQHLNFWFHGFAHWSTAARLIDMSKGGTIHITGLDASAWGVRMSSKTFLINLRELTHSHGTCAFTGIGIRGEFKNNLCGLLYSEWGKGVIKLIGCDVSSQVSTYTYGDMIKVDYGNSPGATVSIDNCMLAGNIRTLWGPNAWQYQRRIVVRDSQWFRKSGPSTVVVHDTSNAGGNTFNKPTVEFDNCSGEGFNNPRSSSGAYIWDATVGQRGDLMQMSKERAISCRGVYGVTLSGTDPLTYNVPIGGMITGMQFLCAAGVGGAPAAPETWTVTNQNGDTVMTFTTPGNLSDGGNWEYTLPQPYSASLAATARLTVTASGANSGSINGAMLLLKGRW